MSRKAKLIAGIIIAVAIAVIGIVVSVSVTANLEGKQQVIVKNAADLENAFSEKTDKTVVLAKDISVDGDLTLGVLNNFDLNGYSLTIKGNLTIKDASASGNYIVGKVDKDSDGGKITAKNIKLDTPKAHVEWSADVAFDEGGFDVSTSQKTFVFSGKVFGTDGKAASEADIKLTGGSVTISSAAENITYNVNIAEGVSESRVENATTADGAIVNIVTSEDVTVAGKVNVNSLGGSVTVTTEAKADVSISGSVASVSGANDSKVTINEGATVSGDVTAGSVVNNGTVTGNVDAGDYEQGENGSVGGEVSCREDTTITASDVTATYNGGAVAVTYTTNNKEGAATVTYYKGADKLTSAPVDAGEYTAVIAIAASENYNAAEKTVGITINKATPSVTAPTAKTLTYTGSAQALVNAGSTTGGTLVYSLEQNGTYGETIPTATNAGSYTVYYKVNGDNNYNDVSAKSVTVTIAKAKVAKPVIDDNSFEYNGKEQGIAIAESDAYTVSGTTSATAVGEYSATVTLNANYTWSDGSETVETYSWSITAGTAVVTTEEELRSALADDGYSTIKLGADILIKNVLDVLENRIVTLDLNGKAITVPAAVDGRSLYAFNNNGTLTVKDTSADETGVISSRGVQNYGKMYLLSGRIESIDSNGGGSAVWNEGYFEMTGGTLAFTGTNSGNNTGLAFNNVTANAEGKILAGNIVSPTSAIFATLGKVTIGSVDSELIIDNIQLANQTKYFNCIKVYGGATAEIVNVSFESHYGGGIEVAGGDVVLRDCDFTQTEYYDWNSMMIAVSNGGSVDIYDCTGVSENYGFYVFNSGGTINIHSGKYSAEKTLVKVDGSTYGSVINIYGGEYSGTFAISGSNAELNVYGGTFDNDPTAYVESGYKTVIKDNGASLSYTVVESGALVEDYDIAVYSDLDENNYRKVDVATVTGLTMLNDFVDDMLGGQGYYVTLVGDIDLAASDLTVSDYTYVDSYVGYALIPAFRGIFDGGNYTVTSKYGLNYIIGVAYGNSEIKDLTVKLTDTRASLTRVVGEYGFTLDKTESDKYYAKESAIELKFSNVDFVTADDSYYDIGSTGNRALYYNDNPSFPYYYDAATKKISYADLGSTYTSDGNAIKASVTIDSCDVTGNFVGGNHASGAAIFSAGQIYGSDFTLTNSSFTGNLVGQYVGFVFANGSGIVDNRLTDGGDGNYVWDDGIVISGNTLDGTITSIGATNGSSLTFGNRSKEPAKNGITVAEGAGGFVRTEANISLTYGESYNVGSLTEDMNTLDLTLKLGTLTCYASENGERLTEASDYTLSVEFALDGTETLDTGIVKVYPRTLEQAVAESIITDESSVEWKTSADGKKYVIVSYEDKDYIVIKANGIDQYFYAFTENAMSKQSRASAFAFNADGILVAMADCN